MITEPTTGKHPVIMWARFHRGHHSDQFHSLSVAPNPVPGAELRISSRDAAHEMLRKTHNPCSLRSVDGKYSLSPPPFPASLRGHQSR